MSLNANLIRGAVGAVAISILLSAGGATAAQIKAATGPQDGDCKRSYEAIVGPSAAAAQAMWVQMVSAKHGTKWAHWVGAKNKALMPVSAGPNPQFQARAQPCFYQPVP